MFTCPTRDSPSSICTHTSTAEKSVDGSTKFALVIFDVLLHVVCDILSVENKYSRETLLRKGPKEHVLRTSNIRLYSVDLFVRAYYGWIYLSLM